jgi:hypothetical protein
VPLIGWVVALPLAAGGNTLAIAAILVATALDHTRAHMRRRVPAKLWGTSIPPRMAWLDRWATPAWLALHAALIWSTLLGRTITWAGRTYRADAKCRVIAITGPGNAALGVEAAAGRALDHAADEVGQA